MTIGVFVDFRNDKFIYLYKKILRNNKKLVFIGQKKHIEVIKKKLAVLIQNIIFLIKSFQII